jgi:signal transduction histidine kinase
MVRSVIERHGGGLHAEGTLGRGAVISFWVLVI